MFAPAEVSAKVGDTIEWINKDVFVHTATARNGDFDVNMPPKKTVTSVLKKAGTVEYYCRFHPNMKAVLTMLAPSLSVRTELFAIGPKARSGRPHRAEELADLALEPVAFAGQ